MSATSFPGPAHNIDTSQIGVPVVTPRKERPGHKRSLTGEPPPHPVQSTNRVGQSLNPDTGSYFPSQPGVKIDDEWPLGDETTWKQALKSQTVDPDDAQAVANTIVRHTTTTLARQAFNMDDVSWPIPKAPRCREHS